MAYTLSERAPGASNLTAKNRVWGFFENSNRTRPANRRKPSELRRKIRLTPTKTASGIPYWPSRDPIEEMGGLNLYGFVRNNGINRWDLLGLQGYGGWADYISALRVEPFTIHSIRQIPGYIIDNNSAPECNHCVIDTEYESEFILTTRKEVAQRDISREIGKDQLLLPSANVIMVELKGEREYVTLMSNVYTCKCDSSNGSCSWKWLHLKDKSKLGEFLIRTTITGSVKRKYDSSEDRRNASSGSFDEGDWKAK